MNDIAPAGIQLSSAALAARWLVAFEAALTNKDEAALAALFQADSHWRDILAFTWHLTPTIGAANIAAGLAAGQSLTHARGFQIPTDRTPPRRVRRLGVDVIEALFAFETEVGRGNGVVRLVPSTPTGSAESGHAYGRTGPSDAVKAWVLSTTLQELKGHEENIGQRRPTGAAFSRNFGGENWADMRRRLEGYADRDPAVLVIGAGQAGLAIAARLNQIGLDTLVVEKWARIGDNWRMRYHSLALHNSIEVDHLPYMPFPPTYPKYVPKDQLGDWFEIYARAMEINCWTSTEFVNGSWDEAAKCWTARLKLADGKDRVMRPRHIVFANGVSSVPFAPKLPGLDTFKGDVLHSEGFNNGEPWKGRNALVIGTGTSGNDIVLDLHSWDVSTTIVQRGSTTVVSIDPSAKLNYALYEEGPPLDDCDIIATSSTPPLLIKAYQLSMQRMGELDRDMIDGLKRIGFKYDIGEDNTGHQMKYRRRGGGYNLDAGSSALMIKGEIGLLQYETIERFCEAGALLKDGTIVPADLIVLATGYEPQSELVQRALGPEIAARVGQVWGIGADGEMANMFKRTPQQGLWFIAGSLPQCRIYSRYLALQIKAMEEGLIGPLA